MIRALPALFLRRAALAAALVAGSLTLGAPVAQAQGILATVNNRAITSLDVAQRQRIAQMIERKRLGSREALEELIDDQAKITEATRVGYRVTEEGVEAEFLKVAKSNGQTIRQFEDVLQRAGLQPTAVRDRIRANLAWQALLRDRAKLGTQVSREELESAARERRGTSGKIVEYTMVPVVFVVPPGTSPGARVAAANAARAKFTGCETGLETLRLLPEVFLRQSITRQSTELSAQLRAVLDKTAVNTMTAPAPGEQGIESIAVCAKKDVTNSENADISSIANEVSNKKLDGGTKAYLADIRKKVMIRYHR